MVLNPVNVTSRLVETLQRDGRQVLAASLARQRWFGGKGRQLTGVRLLDHASVPEASAPTTLIIVEVCYEDASREAYAIPMVVRPRTDPQSTPLLTLQAPEGPVDVWDATHDGDACLVLVDGIRHQRRWAGVSGRFTCRHTAIGESLLSLPIQSARVVSAEQSNTSVVYDDRLILKLIRKLEAGLNPDFEIMEFLTVHTSYRHVPRLVGHIQYEGAEFSATAGVLQTFIPNHGDGWDYALRHLKALLAQQFSAGFFQEMRQLGQITAELHLALASDSSNPAFSPEGITPDDLAGWQHDMESQVRTVMAELRTEPARAGAGAFDLTEESVTILEAACVKRLADLSCLLHTPVAKIRSHGDYHLGQVLKTDQGFTIIDFEGEPARPLADRRRKACPLKDVAGMLRSFNYAANAALRSAPSYAEHNRTVVTAWETGVAHSFLEGYFEAAPPGETSFLPSSREDALRVVRVFQLDKAIYELRYELRNRPDWLAIPLQGLQALLRENGA